MYNARIGRWLSTDRADSFDSPYVGMGNNPGLYADPDGRDVIVLLAPSGATFAGHSALLVGKYDESGKFLGWLYFSKEGTEGHMNSGSYGMTDHASPTGTLYSGSTEAEALDKFTNSVQFAKDKKSPRYTHAIFIDTPHTFESSFKISEAAKWQVMKTYELIGNSCIDVSRDALESIGLISFSGYQPLSLVALPNFRFWFLRLNPGARFYTDELDASIARRNASIQASKNLQNILLRKISFGNLPKIGPKFR